MIHDIDLLHWLLDSDVRSMEAFAPQEAYATATFQFENGTVGTLAASRVTQQKVRSLAITAESAHIIVDYIDQSVEIHRHSVPEYVESDGDVRFRHESVIERPMIENTEPLKNELNAFVTAVREGTTTPVTGMDGLRAIEWVERIEREVGLEARNAN